MDGAFSKLPDPRRKEETKQRLVGRLDLASSQVAYGRNKEKAFKLRQLSIWKRRNSVPTSLKNNLKKTRRIRTGCLCRDKHRYLWFLESIRIFSKIGEEFELRIKTKLANKNYITKLYNVVFQFHRDITISRKIVTILRLRTIKTNIEFLKKKKKSMNKKKFFAFFPSFYPQVSMFFSKFKCKRNIVTSWYHIQFRTSSYFFDWPMCQFFFFFFIISSIQTRKFIKLLIHEIFILSNTIG